MKLCPLRKHSTTTQVTSSDEFKECMSDKCAFWINLNPEAKVDVNVLPGCAVQVIAMKLRYGGGEIKDVGPQSASKAT